MNILRYPCSVAPADHEPGDPPLDIERVLWDLDYRRDMIARLAREARSTGSLERSDTGGR
jgi:hypothetical protein